MANSVVAQYMKRLCQTDDPMIEWPARRPAAAQAGPQGNQKR